MASWVGDAWLSFMKVDWVIGDIVGGDVLSVMVGVVDWLKWGSFVVVTVVGGGPGGVLAGGWLLEGVLIRVAVRRCRMGCILLRVGRGFVLALGRGAVGWQLWGALMVCLFMWVLRGLVGIVGWWLVGSLMVCLHGVMGEKYIWMVVWDRRRRDLEGRAGRASGGIGSCEVVLGSIGVGMLGRSWSCQMSQCSALQSCSGRRAWVSGAGRSVGSS